jgi:hypothetical protein
VGDESVVMVGLVLRADDPGLNPGECPARASLTLAALAARFARQRGTIHAFLVAPKDVDARDKRGHDG